jgi:hypothetical protein
MLSQESQKGMAKQKAPNARRAIVEERGVLRYAAVTRAIAATQQLVSFCDAIKFGYGGEECIGQDNEPNEVGIETAGTKTPLRGMFSQFSRL